MIEETMTVTEAAKLLGVDRSTVQRRLDRGEMKGRRVHAKLWLIPREEVERWRGLGKQRPGPRPAGRGEGDSTT